MPKVLTTVCDISVRRDVEKMNNYGAEKMGGYDVLINTAGISGPIAPAVEIDPGT